MRKHLRRFVEHPWAGLCTLLAVLLYLAVLVGRPTLGRAYEPLVSLLLLALIGLGLRWFSTRADWVIRLRTGWPDLLMCALLLLALALRFMFAPAAAPAPGTDEAHFVEAALRIIQTGEYIPTSLRYPSLLVYAELATCSLRFLTGASSNLWTWPSELSPEHLYGWGRGLVTLLGAATLLPVYWIGSRLYDRRAGLLAAFFLTLLPMHTAAAAIVTPEVPAALLSVLATWFSLRLLEDGAPRWGLAAGVCAGLAKATHYPAALVSLVPLLAACLRTKHAGLPDASMDNPTGLTEDSLPTSGKAAPRWGLILLTCTGALAGFVVACPAALLQTDRLLAGLVEAARAYFPAEGGVDSGLGYLLWEGLGIGPALLVALGAVLALLRSRRQEAVLLLFPVVTYLALLVPRARFARDLVLLAPWLALLAGAGLHRICGWLETRWPDRTWIRRWLPWILALLGGVACLQGLGYLP